MSIYTKTGDKGFASTITQKNISKSSPIFGVLGTLDEMNGALGLAKSQMGEDSRQIIQAVQDDLLHFSGELAGGKPFVTDQIIQGMEQSIDLIMEAVKKEEPFRFITPGATPAGAALDLARSMARRAERQLVDNKKTGGVSAGSLRYINRLSDFIFALARWADSLSPAKGAVSTGSSFNNGQMGQADGFNLMETGLWLCETVRQQARKQGVSVVTAACDPGGHLVALLRDEGAFIASIDVAQNKAFTSVSLQMPTENLETLAAPGGSLYGLQETNGGRIVIFAGGIPLYINGIMIGGFGVSGGSAQQDKELAHYADKVFTEKFR